MKRRNFIQACLSGTAAIFCGVAHVPAQLFVQRQINFPSFHRYSCPTIHLSDIKARRFYIIDRAQIKAKEAIQREEDKMIFQAISAAIDQKTV